MIYSALARLGVRRWHLQAVSVATIWLSLSLWIRAKTVDQTMRANAERRAIFVGLWPPMFWLIAGELKK